MSFERKLNYLFEASTKGYTELNETDIKKAVEKDASDFTSIQKTYHIVPSEVTAEYLSYSPKDNDQTQEYHELLMDNLIKWKEYPKRKNSIKSSTTAKSGNVYVVVPINGSKIGVCSKAKLNESFSYVAINLGIKFGVFNKTLNTLLNVFNNPEGTYDEDSKKITLKSQKNYNDSYKTFYDAVKVSDEGIKSSAVLLDEIAANTNNKETQNDLISIIEYLRAKKISLTTMFDNLFDPAKNNFKVTEFSNFSVVENKDKEIWLNEKCYLINTKSVSKIVTD